ncbi:TonB-dependent receptor [Janthinobacterium sp. PAMC25594]|uniref:TonB-dependent receptor n=1 Tax=Janthinobacterium sp. PAMC25594 TaxID=2861284 RepID=UPI001C639991|nr:TonB-dependent receptor [Janthinobacterium sp. PAMC25594]QYG08899.1 TonB-dependent receptor [Janthinobacterium sp. PAMC25594]
MMDRKLQYFARSTISTQVLLALALMTGQAHAQSRDASADSVPESSTALDAEAIKQRVVISGSNVANRAPVLVSLKATQPQSIITATFIEQAVTPLDDFNAVARIAPSIGAGVSPNGPGLAETKVTLRGFQDGEYNMTYDGIPFGDTNNPTHHSTSYFPARIIGGMVIERGPGNASNLGQATFGGSINLFSKELSQDRHFTPYATVGSWNTRMFGGQVDSGVLDNFGNARLMFNASHLSSDGYLSYSGVKEDNFQFKFEVPLTAAAKLTVFSTYNKIHSFIPDKSGATLSQVARFGKNYSLNNDPTSQNYFGYNYNDKRTDFDYARLDARLGGGWVLENTLYTYAYDNNTFSGQDASGATANGTKAGVSGNKNVPGYNKLNSYRVNGDIVKLSNHLEAGVLRTGVWLENAHSDRHLYDIDFTLGLPNPKEATTPKSVSYDQQSSWKQYQPFIEFEWAAAPSLTVTPGLKYVHFKRALNAGVNQGTRIPTDAEQTYTSTLPFLSANYSFTPEWSAYAQTARGFLVPDLSMFYVNNPSRSKPQPQTSTNYQLGAVHQSSNLSLDGDIYYIDFNNKIASTGMGNDLVYYNQGGVVYKGIEGAATYYVGSGFSLHANGSLNSAKSKETGLSIAKVPQSTTALGLLYKANGLFGSLIAKRNGSQYAKDGQPAAYKLGAYITTDLSLGYRWKTPGSMVKAIKLQGGINNLLNKQDATSISVNSKGAAFDQYTFIPERSATVSLSADF